MAQLFSPIEATLSNGIRVILHPTDGEVAAIYWWNQVGSAHESASEAGFAHFLEHMLFKDASAKETGQASTGQLALQVESLGGDINAYTSFEQTVYHVTCASQHFSRVLQIFGQMAKPQKFLKKDFQQEREVILEELKKNEDSPGRMMFQRLLKNTFKTHPYGRPVIGFTKTLKSATVQTLERFYRNHYSPEKMGVIIVAPMPDLASQKKILGVLEKLFGKKVIPTKKNPFRSPPRKRDAEISKTAIVDVMEFDVQTPTVSISFRAPDLVHEDVVGIDLMTSIVGAGEVSRLYKKLFYEENLVIDASLGAFIPGDPGLLTGSIEVSEIDQILPAFNAFLKVIEESKSAPIHPDEIQRVITHSESEKLYALQTADGVASRLGFLKFVLGDLNFDEKYLSRLKSLTEGELHSIARKYFDPRRMSVVIMVPKGKKSEVDVKGLRQSIEQELTSETKSDKASLNPKNPAAAEVIENKVGFHTIRTHREHSPVFGLYAVMPGGLRAEAVSKSGLGYLTSMTWTKGSAKHTALQIAHQMESRAASIDAFSGRNAMGLQMTGLSRDFEELSEIFLEVLLSPQFANEELERSRRIALDSIRSIDEHSSQLCSKLFLSNLFENHPYGRMTIGEEATIKALQVSDLKDFHNEALRRSGAVFSFSGRVTEDQWSRFSERLQSGLAEFKNQSSAELKSVQHDDEPELKAPRWVEKVLGREQIHIIVGGLGTRVNDEDRHAIRLLQSLLGGQSGPLFIELREKKSLAYTVAPLHFEGIERGYVGTYIACSPDKREEAIQGIRATLEKVHRSGLSPSALKRAKEYLLGRRAMDLQGDSSIASHYGIGMFYGIHPEDEKKIIQKIKNLTATDLRRVLERYYLKPHQVTATVG